MIVLRMPAKDMALLVCFTALYALFYSLPVFPIIGLSGAAITAAAIMAPLTGIILGSFLGMLSAILGGMIVFFLGRFSLVSLIATGTAAFCAGLLYAGKRKICALVYLLLLVVFGFYPFIGPFWLYPILMWFQLIIFLILLSPLYSISLERMKNSTSGGRLFPHFLLISLISTLAGQIAGSLAFEIIFWPTFIGKIEVWAGIWKAVTWIYPVERLIIALFATVIGIPLFRALKNAKLI